MKHVSRSPDGCRRRQLTSADARRATAHYRKRRRRQTCLRQTPVAFAGMPMMLDADAI